MAINLTFRHYFSEVAYRQFYTLKDNGELNPDTSFTENKDGTFNSWNLIYVTVGGLRQVHNSLYCTEIKLKIS